MKKFLFCVLMLFACSNVYASPGQKVCVEVYAVSGYDGPGVTDEWYDDVYDVVSNSLKNYNIDSENASDVWREFVYRLEDVYGTTDIGRKDAHKMYADFRKDRFDTIMQLKTAKYVNYKNRGRSDVEVALVVKDPKNIDGEPLMVLKDSKTFPRGDVDLFNELKVMTDGLIKRCVNS